MRNMTIMHRKYLTLEQYHYNYNTVTVIVALSAHHALSPALIDSDSKQSLQEEKERP